MTMNILVTGANGFIGRELCSQLKGAGYTVRGAVRTSVAAMDGLVDEVVETGDIGSDPDWSKA